MVVKQPTKTYFHAYFPFSLEKNNTDQLMYSKCRWRIIGGCATCRGINSFSVTAFSNVRATANSFSGSTCLKDNSINHKKKERNAETKFSVA